ncbi:MAG: DNA polymerase III subunit epsilon [Proteobacteria bacterium]|nr:DNA polymerase III subunit epsilon [Pseudomonadota bacterium]
MSGNSTRQIMLDTETTGIAIQQGNRILEIGAVEVINREITGNQYQQYINPQRDSEPGALEVHGITTDFLADKPIFSQVVDEFIDYIKGAELVIHNAPFDVGFINNEFMLCGKDIKIEEICTITDSLDYARNKHPGARNSLDALCKRYGVVNQHRTLHGALLDSQILAEVYLMLTGGQRKLNLDMASTGATNLSLDLANLPVLTLVKANNVELEQHQKWLDNMSDGGKKEFIYNQDS